MNGANTDPNMPESIHPPAEVVVYICPTTGCGNYFASTSFRPDRSDIESVQHHRSQNDGKQVASHPRIECPDCRTLDGLHINRIPYVVTQVVPLDRVVQYLGVKADKAKSKADSQATAPSELA